MPRASVGRRNAELSVETCWGSTRLNWEHAGMVLEQVRHPSALVRLLRPHARRWAGLAVLVAASSALLLAGPLVIRRIVDRATTGASTGELQRLALLFLAIVVVGQIVEIIVVRSATVGAWRTTNQLRLDMTNHVLGLDHEHTR